VNTSIQDQSDTRKTVTASFSAEEVANIAQTVFKEYHKHAQLPGFRPGKAPANMIKTRFAKKIAEDLKQRLVVKANEEAIEKGDLELYSMIDMQVGDVKEDAPAEVVFTVDVVPSFTLPDFKSLTVEPVDSNVSDEEVQTALDRIRSQRAEFNPVERPAAKGDYVRCSYEGTLDGKPVAEIAPDAPMYGSQKSTWEEAGADEGSPGVRAIAEGLVGMSKDEEKTVEQTFPDDFTPAELAGKTASYTIKVEEVRERVLPEIDEAFLKSVQAESEEALRNRLKQELEQRKAYEGRSKQKQQIVESLREMVDFPLPESGVEHETQSLLENFMRRNLQQGASMADFEAHKESLYEGAAKSAQASLKDRFILLKIADAESITVSHDDLSQAVYQEAMMQRVKPEKFVAELKKDRSRIRDLQRNVLLGKTVDWLLNQALGEDKDAAKTDS
jgi:trigger factor